MLALECEVTAEFKGLRAQGRVTARWEPGTQSAGLLSSMLYFCWLNQGASVVHPVPASAVVSTTPACQPPIDLLQGGSLQGHQGAGVYLHCLSPVYSSGAAEIVLQLDLWGWPASTASSLFSRKPRTQHGATGGRPGLSGALSCVSSSAAGFV